MKNIIIFAVVFIISFISFNQGMNDIFEDYTITLTSISMVVVPLIAVTMCILFLAFMPSIKIITEDDPEQDK